MSQTTQEAPEAEQADDPFDGNPSWRLTRQLPDGTSVTLRPIVPGDREPLRHALRLLSPRSRFMRFFGEIGDPSEKMLTYLTQVDQHDHVAIVATVASPDLKTENGIAVGRWIRSPEHPDVAEAAITVLDEMQRRGVGTLLAIELARAARAQGIHRIRADVLRDNATMIGILEQVGAKPVQSDDPEMISYDIDLDHGLVTERSLPDRLRSVLRGAAETMAVSLRRLLTSVSSNGHDQPSSTDEPAQGERTPHQGKTEP